MCGVPVHAAEGYLLTLIRKGFRVAVCEQMESPAEAKKRGYKSVVKRDVVRLVTPGTLTEESLLESSAGTPGLLWVGIIDAVGISEDGPAAVVTFKVIESSDSDTLLILQNVVAYDAASYLDIIVEASPGSFSTMDGSITPPSLTFAP